MTVHCPRVSGCCQGGERDAWGDGLHCNAAGDGLLREVGDSLVPKRHVSRKPAFGVVSPQQDHDHDSSNYICATARQPHHNPPRMPSRNPRVGTGRKCAYVGSSGAADMKICVDSPPPYFRTARSQQALRRPPHPFPWLPPLFSWPSLLVPASANQQLQQRRQPHNCNLGQHRRGQLGRVRPRRLALTCALCAQLALLPHGNFARGGRQDWRPAPAVGHIIAVYYT